MNIVVYSDNYWGTLQNNSQLSSVVANHICSMVNCYLHNLIPPTVTSNILGELKDSKITEITLMKNQTDYDLLEISIFFPDNRKTGRCFTFLRKTYPNGQCGSLKECLHEAFD